MKKDDCCPQFDPTPWEGKTHVWNDKLFIVGSVPQFLHIPFPPMFAATVTRMWKRAEEAQAAPDLKDFILMAYDPSPWKSELYMTVTKDVPGEKSVRLSGTFITKVFDGPYNAPPKWVKEFDEYLSGQSKKALKYYFYFTYCPKCSKKFGHNYCVVFAQVQ
ncbi:MAG: hypothetical protein JW782_02780 [Candidatus Saganbacteria bacterium]|nr:hypothetical protein [Candidatus Saganbacteria bacterium]